MRIRNKQTKRERDVTPQEFERLRNQSEQHKTLYEVVTEQPAPPIPKEVKKMSGKQTPESDNDGLQTNFDGLPDQNAG
jgi:hypothetical protein